MITFEKIYEFLFHSFRVRSSLAFLEEVSREKIDSVIIVKRSWVYGLFLVIFYILMIGTLVALLGFHLVNMDNTSLFILVFSLFSLLFLGVILHIYYLVKYARSRNVLTRIHDYESVITELTGEEKNFSRFFNWITTLYYLIGIVFLLSCSFLILGNPSFGFFFIGSILLIWVLMAYYRRKMIDLDMDYIIVVPNRIFFVDQMGVYRKSESIKWLNNIRLVTSSYPNALASLLDYGTIEVTVKNDTQAILDKYHMHYVDRPSSIVKEMQKIIDSSNRGY